MLLRLSGFRNVTDTKPKLLTLTGHELCSKVFAHRESEDKKASPLISAAIYPPGTRRAKNNVLEVTCAIGDFDKGRLPFSKIKEHLNRLDVQYIAHSTFSHTEEVPCYRVIIPFTDPVPAGDWPEMWERFNQGVFMGMNDPATKDASRIYFLPTCKPGAPHFLEMRE